MLLGVDESVARSAWRSQTEIGEALTGWRQRSARRATGGRGYRTSRASGGDPFSRLGRQ